MKNAITAFRIDRVFLLVLAITGAVIDPVWAQELPLGEVAIKKAVEPPEQRFALVVVGLPGDDEHRDLFLGITATWRRWLTEVAGVNQEQITVLTACDDAEGSKPPTADVIAAEVSRLRGLVSDRDALWVFLLGHGSQEGRRGFFHLPGPDMDGSQWAALFSDLDAREQVFWLTQAASGSFLRDLSQQGRVIVTATDADGEQNETRFPSVLATEMELRLGLHQPEASSNQETEPAGESPLDVLGLFRAVSQRVSDQFDEANLVPTEHALLDDNGDGQGTEFTGMSDEPAEVVPGAASPIDGGLAGSVSIEFKNPEENPSDEAVAPIESDNEPEPASTDDEPEPASTTNEPEPAPTDAEK